MKSSKIIIVFVVILLIALLAVGAYAYFYTDMFATPEKLFKKYLYSGYNQLTEFNLAPFDEIYNKSATEKINFKVFAPNKEETQYMIDISADQEANASATAKIYFSENTDPLTVSTALSKKAVGLKIEELYDKYLVIENRNLKKLAGVFITDEEVLAEIPDSIPVDENTVNENSQKLNELYNEYVQLFISKFDPNTCFSTEKNVEVVVKDTNINTTKVSFKSTEAEIAKNLQEVLDQLKTDQRFIDLYKEVYNKDLPEELEDKMKIDSDVTEDPVEISLYIADQKTVKAEFVSKENSASLLFIDNNNLLITGRGLTSSWSEVYRNYTIEVSNSFDGTNGNFVVSVETKYDSTEEYSYYKDSKANISLKSKSKDNGCDYELFITSDDEEQQLLDATFTYGENVNVEQLIDLNSEVINDYTKLDFTNLAMQLSASAQKYMTKNPNSGLSMLLSYFFRNSYDYNDYGYDYGYKDPSYSYENNTDIDEELEKTSVQTSVENGINDCLYKFKQAQILDPNANIAEYLTVENIQSFCEDFSIELIDGTTLMCTMNNNSNKYSATMNIDGGSLTLTEVTVEKVEEPENTTIEIPDVVISNEISY